MAAEHLPAPPSHATVTFRAPPSIRRRPESSSPRVCSLFFSAKGHLNPHLLAACAQRWLVLARAGKRRVGVEVRRRSLKESVLAHRAPTSLQVATFSSAATTCGAPRTTPQDPLRVWKAPRHRTDPRQQQLDLEVSAGWVCPCSRGLCGGALLLSAGNRVLQLRVPWQSSAWCGVGIVRTVKSCAGVGSRPTANGEATRGRRVDRQRYRAGSTSLAAWCSGRTRDQCEDQLDAWSSSGDKARRECVGSTLGLLWPSHAAEPRRHTYMYHTAGTVRGVGTSTCVSGRWRDTELPLRPRSERRRRRQRLGGSTRGGV
jgi:hypothetical protein